MNAHGGYVTPCRVLSYMYPACGGRMRLLTHGLIYAMRGLSALSVSTIWAMREPRLVGWAKANPTLYFCRDITNKTITIFGDWGSIRI